MIRYLTLWMLVKMDIEGERRLWNEYIVRMVSDAIFPFVISDETSIQKQHMNFLNGKKRFVRYAQNHTHIEQTRALSFLESSRFNEVCFMIGYDTLFVKKTFDFVQDCLTRKKQIYKTLNKRYEVQQKKIAANSW